MLESMGVTKILYFDDEVITTTSAFVDLTELLLKVSDGVDPE
jgi:hypothetical protein